LSGDIRVGEGVRFFRFENIWLGFDGFNDVIKEWWGRLG